MSLGGWEGIPDWPMLLRLESSPRRGPEWRGRRTTYHCSLVLPWEDLSHILGDAGTLKLQPLTLVHDLVLQDKGHPWRRDPRWSIHSIPMIPPPFYPTSATLIDGHIPDLVITENYGTSKIFISRHTHPDHHSHPSKLLTLDSPVQPFFSLVEVTNTLVLPRFSVYHPPCGLSSLLLLKSVAPVIITFLHTL